MRNFLIQTHKDHARRLLGRLNENPIELRKEAFRKGWKLGDRLGPREEREKQARRGE
ncbi:hypothetical protein MASR2M8_17900 [Opitutaceae bacterium]